MKIFKREIWNCCNCPNATIHKEAVEEKDIIRIGDEVYDSKYSLKCKELDIILDGEIPDNCPLPDAS